MFSKIERRLFKEGVLALARKEPETLSARRFWMDTPDGLDNLTAGMRAIQSVDILPLPDSPCVLCSPCGHWVGTTHVPQGGVTLCAITSHDTPHDQVEILGLTVSLRRFYGVESVSLYPCGNAFRTEAFAHYCTWAEFETRDDLDKYWDSYCKECPENQLSAHARPESGNGFWMSLRLEGDTLIHAPDMSVLFVLSASAFPCGYKVFAAFSRGFGPEYTRELTKSPILCHVRYDRLYRVIKDSGAEPPEVSPHHRRGHYRYLWKESGIDRLTLPESVSQRMAVALQSRVRKVYVHPAWIGKTQFSDDGVDWNIQTGETPA